MKSKTPSPWANYLAAAAEMRLVVQQNEDDFDFEKEHGGRIVYIFDANVINLFINPADGIRHILGFGGPASHNDRLATTMIAAEFMFSRQLSGQHGIPPYVSPGHAEDLNSIAGGIRSRFRRQGPPGSFEHQAAARITKIVEAVKSERLDDIAARQILMETLPEFAAALFNGPPYEARQFTRLISSEGIRPLALLPEATSDVMKPHPRQVAEWEHRIKSELAASGAHHRQADRIERDASTIAQLLALNENASGEMERTKYVLVTADRALTRAYSRYFGEYRHADPRNYALRQPHQYLPILNTQQLSRGQLRSELIGKLREAFDSLFPFSSLDPDEHRRLMLAIADPSLADMLSPDDRASSLLGIFLNRTRSRSSVDVLEVVRKHWQEASRAAVLLNSSWLKEHFKGGWEAATEMIHSTRGMDQGLVDHLAKIVGEVESAHAAFVADKFLQPSKKLDVHPARPLLRSWPTEREAMSNPASRLDAGNRFAHVFTASEEPGHEWRMLAWAAQSAFMAKQWDVCARFANRAAILMLEAPILPDRREFDRHELIYLECASARLRIDDENYARSRMLLQQSMRFYMITADEFGLARVRLETCGLEFARWISNNQASSFKLGRTVAVRHFFSACDELREARLLLDHDHPSSPLEVRLLDQLDEMHVLLGAVDLIALRAQVFQASELLDLEGRIKHAGENDRASPLALWAARCCRALSSPSMRRERQARELISQAPESVLPSDNFEVAIVNFLRDALAGSSRNIAFSDF